MVSELTLFRWYLVAQMVKLLLTMEKTWVQSLGLEDPLEKEMATHSSTLAWKIPWTEECGKLQSMGSQRVEPDWTTLLTHSLTHSHARKVMLKILQARLQQYVNHEFLMFKLYLEKAEEREIKLLASVGSSKKPENSRKTTISALLTVPKSLCGSQQTGKSLKRWEYQTIWSASWEICIQVKKQQLERDMEQ